MDRGRTTGSRPGRLLSTIAGGTLLVGSWVSLPSTGGPHVAASGAAAGALAAAQSGHKRHIYVRTPGWVFKDVTSVPMAVYNAVGVRSPHIAVMAPVIDTHHPRFTYEKLAGAFFWGAEYCPYCAATRWGLIAALSRFGSFNKLYNIYSSPRDVDPNTPSFTFFMTKYRSKYLVFHGYEVEDLNMAPLMRPPARINALVAKYNPQGYFPFVDVGNVALLLGSAIDPHVLHGLNRDQIAHDLKNKSNPVTKAIVTEANYFSAAICYADGGKPVAVCTSPGVLKAAAALKLPHLTH